MFSKMFKKTMILFTSTNDKDSVNRNREKVVCDDKDQSWLDASTDIAPSSFQERRSEIGDEVEEKLQNLTRNCTTVDNHTSSLVAKCADSECQASTHPPLKKDLVTVVRPKRRYQRRNSFVVKRNVKSMTTFEHKISAPCKNI